MTKQIEVYEKKYMMVDEYLSCLRYTIADAVKVAGYYKETDAIVGPEIKHETYPIRTIGWWESKGNINHVKHFVICDEKINDSIESTERAYKGALLRAEDLDRDKMRLNDKLERYVDMNFKERLQFLFNPKKIKKEWGRF